MKDLDWPRAVVYGAMIIGGVVMLAMGLDKVMASTLITAGIAGAGLPQLTGGAARQRQVDAAVNTAVDKALSVPPMPASDIPSLTLPIEAEPLVEPREAPTSPGRKADV